MLRILLKFFTVCLLLGSSGGCIKECIARLKGPGFDDRSKQMTAEIPEREDAGKPHCLSTKAQEIEADFGYQ